MSHRLAAGGRRGARVRQAGDASAATARSRPVPGGCRPTAPGVAAGRPGGSAEPERQRRRRSPAGIECARGAQNQLGRAGRAERVGHRPAQDFVNQSLIEKADLRLRRVHVDVHAVGPDLDEEVHLRAALFDRRDAVRLLDRVGDRAIADDAPVHEDVPWPSGRALLPASATKPWTACPRPPETGTRSVDPHKAGRTARRSSHGGVRSARARRCNTKPVSDIRGPAASRCARSGRLRRYRLSGTSAGREVEQIGDFDERAFGRSDLASRHEPVGPTRSSVPVTAPRGRVRSRNRETEAIDGNASPRNPSV